MKRNRLEEIIGSFKNRRIAIVGDVMLDIFRYGPDHRLSPEEPGTVIINEEKRIEKLGGAGNVISNLASLGGEVYLFGIIGNDDYGKILERLIDDCNVKKKILLKDTRKTTVKERIIAVREGRKRQLIRIDREDVYEINSVLAYDIIKALKNNIYELDGIILQDYSKGLLTDYLTDAIIRLANENGVPVFVDPKDKIIKNATIFKPNRGELFKFSGAKDIASGCEILYKRINSEHLIVTAGDEGIYIFNKDGLNKIPTIAKEVVDVMGAGDTVIASLALAYTSGAGIYDSVDIANHAARVVVSKLGTATAKIDEIRKSFLENGVI